MAVFSFRFTNTARSVLGLAGITPDNSMVTVDQDEFAVQFGRYRMRTPLTNLTGFHVSGGYRWHRAIGLRLSLADSGITFGSNVDRGICVTFEHAIDPVGPLMHRRHPGATVTVADVDALAELLRSEGIFEIDA